MTAEEVQALLQNASLPVLVDVLTPESFARRHLPGAVNACVYETVFLSHCSTIAPDKATRIIVYGGSPATLAASVAREKLREAGYLNVEEFHGGLTEWQAKGFPLEENSAAPEPPSLHHLDGAFAVDPARSAIFWTGRNLFNHHHGSLQLAGGSFKAAEGNFTAAEFAVDMGSISCSDLTDPAYNALLLAHLASNDFFDVSHHPTAQFRAGSIVPIEKASPGWPNFRLAGDFTLRGITLPLEFAAVCAVNEAGEFVAQAEFDLDRTKWGALYGSGRFFEALGKHVVNDLVHLHVVLVATKHSVF